MLRGIRARLTLTFLAIIALMAVGLGLALPEVARSHQMTSVQQLLLGEARLAADYYATAGLSDAAVDAWVKRLHQPGDATLIRLTIIAADGRVIGDSDEQPERMDNHATRPEVRQALAEGSGSSVRYSTTLHYETLYVAVSIVGSGGVARAALPLAEIDHMVAALRRNTLIVAAVAAAIAALLALYIANALARPLRELTEMAGVIAAGRFDRRAAVRGSAETARLAEALNTMAQELRRSFGAIESQRDSLSTIMANMADGIVMIDGDGRVAMVNAAAARMLRTDPKQAEGRHFSAVLRDHELIELARRANSARGATDETAMVERVAPRRYLRGVATRIGEGMTAPTLLVLQDLTEVRRLETIRRDFVANVSHELRTPLTAIKAMVETLESGAIDDAEAARDFVARVHREVDSLSQLIEDLLELSRAESGPASLQLTAVAPADLVADAVERLGPLAERAGVVLVAEPAVNLPPVLADRERIHQVLSNLIQNAIKFTPPPGRVTVSAHRSDGAVAIAVADNGIGIDSDDLPRLFERFYKADKARSGGGSGLGLAIVKHLVLAHGGQVWAESRGPDRGSTFTFTLPIAE